MTIQKNKFEIKILVHILIYLTLQSTHGLSFAPFVYSDAKLRGPVR